MENQIKNFETLARTEEARDALLVAAAGLDALNTEKAMQRSIRLEGEILTIQEKKYDLTEYESIKVVGFGKASADAAMALENILASRIREGVVISLNKADTKFIETFAGTHPKPSEENIRAGEKIFKLLKGATEKDLIIALVSGGGSALLCSSEEELAQGVQLYDAFLKTGKTISELNTVRKHLSILKGGGLAVIAYPATVIGLIFSDVPGDNFGDVASGPTYKDLTTLEDAQKIITENGLGNFKLMETTKDEKYFEKVSNFVIVSNKIAVEAMALKSKLLGYDAEIISTDMYDQMDAAVEKIFSKEKIGTVVLAAGEPGIKVTKHAGKGGRNTHMALMALAKQRINPGVAFISIASDGLDNSDAAGALVDTKTIESFKKQDMDPEVYLHGFNSYAFFEKAGGLIITGPTGANVSDLMVLVRNEITNHDLRYSVDTT